MTNIPSNLPPPPNNPLPPQQPLSWYQRVSKVISASFTHLQNCFINEPTAQLGLQIKLNGWKNSAPLNEQADRQIVCEAILTFIANPSAKKCDFSNLCITSLPDVFGMEFLDHLEKITITSCPELTDISALSQCYGLSSLWIKGSEHLTDISALSGLPRHSLKELILDSCSALTDINALSYCSGLKEVRLDSCVLLANIDALSSCLQLKVISLARCARILQIPRLSATLRGFDAAECVHLTDISSLIACTGLWNVRLSGCTALTDVSALRSQPFLQHVWLDNCSALTQIPLSWTDLRIRRERGRIDVSNCPLLPSNLMELSRRINESDYGGPFFVGLQVEGTVFLPPEERRLKNETPLQQDLALVCTLAGHANPPYFPNLLKNNTVEDYNHCQILSAWLGRLSDAPEIRLSGHKEQRQLFYQLIVQHLVLANRDSDFREIFWSNIAEGHQTCGDRVALSVLRLGIAKARVETKDKGIQPTLRALKQAWSIDLLEEWTIDLLENDRLAAPSRFNHDEELEVYLAIPIQLQGRLQLELNVQNMLFFSITHVTGEDLNNAEQYVKTQWKDEEAFATYLIKQPEWSDALTTSYPKEMAEIAELKERRDQEDVEEEERFELHAKMEEKLKNLTLREITHSKD